MEENDITFHNEIKIKVQTQIFVENELVSTSLVEPGQSCTMISRASRFDIYCKNSITGWRLAYKLNSEANILTLSGYHGGYIIKDK